MGSAFKSKRQLKRFSKAYALLRVYHNSFIDNDHIDASKVSNECFLYAEKELLKMNLPEGWKQNSGSYEIFLKFFLNKDNV